MKKYLLIAGGITAIVAAVSVYMFLNVGSWLVVADPVPGNLDVIFTFAGEGVRVNYSRELVGKFQNAHWVLSDYKDGYARILRKDGFDMQRVTTIDTCSNTISEVDALENWIVLSSANGSTGGTALKSPAETLNVGLVSSPYHMRRIKLMVNREFNNHQIQFHYLPVPLERYRWDTTTFRKWWTVRQVRSVVSLEIQKILYFWLLF